MRKIKLREGVDLANLFGPQDLHLKMIEGELQINMAARGDEITLDGQPESVQRAEHILQELADWTRAHHELKPEDISRAIRATGERLLGSILAPTTGWLSSRRRCAGVDRLR